MRTRTAAILGAAIFALTAGSVHAADMEVAVPLAGGGCNCGPSDMIVVYDFQPGVVKRSWPDCECRHEPAPRYRPVSGLPAYAPQFPVMNEPWRRY